MRLLAAVPSAPLACCLALWFAAPAEAATVQLASTHPRISSYDGLVLSVDAVPGERNDVVLGLREGRTTVADFGAPLTAGTGCRREVNGTVSCDPERVDVWVVELGDGDDALAVQGAFGNAWYFGGDGNDRITGAGGGSEAYSGGAGSDVLRGGAGRDVFDEDGVRHSPEVDIYDGGEGSDHINYSAPTRERGVTVDLAAGNGPEGDRLIGIESMHGTDHDDVLVGNRDDGEIYAGGGHDSIDAGAGDDKVWTDLGGLRAVDGNDTVLGGSGDDQITSGGGRDRLDGGPGDDLLTAERRARVRCGSGTDRRSADEDRRLRVPRDCELLAAGSVVLSAHPRLLPRRRIAFRAYCWEQGCRASLELRAVRAGRRLARSRIRQIHPKRGRTFVLPRPRQRRIVAVIRIGRGAARFPLLLPR